MLHWIGRVAGWAVILGASAVLAAGVLVPRLGGGTPYAVLTGSMRPDLPPGTLVVVRPVNPVDIGVGSVITYQLESGKPAVVTHRVVSQGLDRAANPVFATQGDANDAPDEKWVRPVQIQGELWYSVPYLGYLTTLLTGHERQLGVDLVAAGLAGYALWSFVGAALGRRRGARPGARPGTPPDESSNESSKETKESKETADA
jgi:signal peptidase